MSDESVAGGRVIARVAGWLAGRDPLPTAVQAVLGYAGRTGNVALSTLPLQRTVEQRVDAIVEDAYDEVEAALREEFDAGSVAFDYDTKLTMPVELTLGHVYARARAGSSAGVDPVANERRTDPVSRLRRRPGHAKRDPEEAVEEVRRAEELAELVVVALLDGDMRDAINDDEYGDFEVDVADDEAGRRRAAEVAQSVLEERVDGLFASFDDDVRAAYEHAVDVSERHQDRDEHFREMLASASDGTVEARERLREEYRDAAFDDPPEVFTDADLALPYLKTQYGRVGVIYDGMVEMFRAGGVPLGDAFKRSVVLAIVGAQIWLDDVDDYHADVAAGQLTPVTAEYLLADDDAAAARRVVALTNDYLDRAANAAATSNSPLTGIGIEYIRHAGDPSKLPN